MLGLESRRAFHLIEPVVAHLFDHPVAHHDEPRLRGCEVLVGGEGEDVVIGQQSRDVLVGGFGQEGLVGDAALVG